MPENNIHPDDLALVQQLDPNAGKTTPVETTDAPAQVEPVDTSTSASSGDSSPTPVETETKDNPDDLALLGIEPDGGETKVLPNGNQVVDGIEYTEEGIEIGAYKEGETQGILESRLEPEEDDTFVEGRLKVHRNRGIDRRNRTTTFGVLDTNQEIFYEGLQKERETLSEEHLLASEEFQGMQEDFSLVAKPKLQEYAQELQSKNPDITEEEFDKKLTAYQQELWGDLVASDPAMQTAMSNAQLYAEEQTGSKVDKFYKQRNLALKIEGVKNANFFQRMGIAGGHNPLVENGELTMGGIMFQLGTSGSKYLEEGIWDSMMEQGHLDQVANFQKFQGTYDNLLSQGDLSKEKHAELTKENEINTANAKLDHAEALVENLQDGEVNAALDSVIQDSDDPNFLTTKNVILSVVDQLPNLLPGLFAANPVGLAIGTLLYAQQLNDEYADKAYTALAARNLGIDESAVTPQQISDAATSPEGVALLADIRVKGLIGAIPSVISSRLQLAGGSTKVLSKMLGNPKVLKVFSKATAKLANKNLLTKFGVRIGEVGLAQGFELTEELAQETIGDFQADRVRTPEKGRAELLGDAVTRVAPWNWTKEYKDLAASTLLSSGGSTAVFSAGGAVISKTQSAISNNKLQKIANLSQEEFTAKVDIEKTALNNKISDPTLSDKDKEPAIRQYQQLLDTEEAYNEIQKYPHIRGNNKTETLKLLKERNSLKRTVKALEGSGLATEQKDRMKSIDEQLDGINRRSREGETGTVFDDLRRLVRPKQSVGAARKANLPQKAVDNIEDLWSKGFSVDKILNKLTGDPTLSGIPRVNLETEIKSALAQQNTDGLNIKTPPNISEEEGQLRFINSIERFWKGNDGKVDIDALSRVTKNYKPADISEGQWQQQLTGIIGNIEGTGRSTEALFSKDLADAQKADEVEAADVIEDETTIDPDAEKPIGTRAQKQIEKRFHEQGIAVPPKYTDRFSNPYIAPEFKAEETNALDVNATDQQRLQAAVQQEVNKRLEKNETERQTDKLVSSVENKKRSNVAQSIANEGFKPSRLNAPRKSILSELKQLAKDFNSKTEYKVAHLKAKMQTLLATIQITDQAILNELPSGVWETLTQDVNDLAEAVKNRVGNKEQQAINIKQLHDRESKMKKVYALALKAYEAKVYNKGVKSGVFPAGFNVAKGEFDFGFKPDDYIKTNDEFFGSKDVYENLSLKQWFNFQKQLAFIKDYKDQLVDTSGLDARKKQSIVDQINKRTEKLKDAMKKISGKLSTKEVANNIVENIPNVVPEPSAADNLKALSKIVGDITIDEVVAETKSKFKKIDKTKPTFIKNLLYTDKKTALETDIIYNALIMTNKELSDKDLLKLFKSGYVAFAQAEGGLAGLAENSANIEDLRVMIEEYIELFGEDNLAILYDQAKEIKYLQTVGQRAAHGSPVAQAALIQSINPWLNKLVTDTMAEGVYRGTTTEAQRAEGLDSIDLGLPEREYLKTAAVDGALKAIQTWDPSKGKFITYATKFAQGEIISSIKRWNGDYAEGKDSQAEYEKVKLETMEYLESQAKIEIARNLYLRSLSPELSDGINSLREEENAALEAGLNEMKGEDIDVDPRNIPKLSKKAQALLDGIQNDPRQRRVAHTLTEIDKLRRLNKINPDVEVQHIINQHESNIRLLGNPNIQLSDVPTVVVPESVINTRGGYLATGSDLALEQYNNLVALPSPNKSELAEIGILEEQLIDEAQILADELGNTISEEGYQNSKNVNGVLSTEIKRLDAQLEEAGSTNKSILLGRDPNQAITPKQQEQIESNNELVKAVTEVKGKMKDSRKRNGLLQLAVSKGMIEVIGVEGPLSKDKVDAIVPTQKSEITTVLTPGLASVKAAAGKSLGPALTVAKEATVPVVSTSEKSVAIQESFNEMALIADELWNNAERKRKEAEKIADEISGHFNPNKAGDDFGFGEAWEGTTDGNHVVDENENPYGDDHELDLEETYQPGEMFVNDDNYGKSEFQEGEKSFYGSEDSGEGFARHQADSSGGISGGVNNPNVSSDDANYGQQTVFLEGERGKFDNQSLTQLGETLDLSEGNIDTNDIGLSFNDLTITRKEASKLEEINSNLILLGAYKNSVEGNLNEVEAVVSLVESTKELVKDHSTFLGKRTILSAADERLQSALDTAAVQMENVLSTVALEATNVDPTVDQGTFTPRVEKALEKTTENTKKAVKGKNLKSNTLKMGALVPSLLIASELLGPDGIQAIIDGFAYLVDAIQYAAEIVFGHEGLINLSTAAIVPIIRKKRSRITNAPIDKSLQEDSKKPFEKSITAPKIRTINDDRKVKLEVIRRIKFSGHLYDQFQDRFGTTDVMGQVNKNIDGVQILKPGQDPIGVPAKIRETINKKRENEHYAKFSMLLIPGMNALVPFIESTDDGQKFTASTVLYADGFRGDAKSHASRDKHDILIDNLKHMAYEYFFNGVNNKRQILKRTFEKMGDGIWSDYNDYRKSMQALFMKDGKTQVNFNQDLITDKELKIVEAALELKVYQKSQPGPVYKGKNKAMTDGLTYQFKVIDGNTNYASENEVGNPRSSESKGRKTGIWAINDLPLDGPGPLSTADVKKYSFTDLKGIKRHIGTGYGMGWAATPFALEIVQNAYKQKGITRKDKIKMIKLIWINLGPNANTPNARDALKKATFGITYDQWFEASTPSEQKKMLAMEKTALRTPSGTIPVYRGVSIVEGLSESQHIAPSTSVSFDIANDFATSDRTSESTGNDRVLMAMINPKEHFFIGFKNTKNIEQEMMLNPNKPFPNFKSTKAQNMDSVIDNETDNQICN